MNKELFQLYEDMYNLHVGTKTNDTVFHSSSAAFYETLFAVVHGVDESMQDSKQEPPINPSEARKQSYVILEKAKKIVEGLVESNKDMAVDNVLRGLVDKLGFECGNARAFAAGECPMKKGKEEAGEVESEDEDVEEAAEDAEEQEEEEYEGMANTEEEVVGGPAKEEEDENKKKKPVDVTMVEIIPE